MKSVIKGSYKSDVGAGAETFWKSEPEREQKVSAPQHWLDPKEKLTLSQKTGRILYKG